MNHSIIIKILSLSLIFFASLCTMAVDFIEIDKDGKHYRCEEQVGDHHEKISLRQLCDLGQSGHGETIYYPNGKVFTYSAGVVGSTWYYENGNVMTYGAGTKGATWYYHSGHILTYSAGQQGATWYYDNGKIISYSMGTEGATMYYDNGSVMTYSAPQISEEKLLYPCSFIE